MAVINTLIHSRIRRVQLRTDLWLLVGPPSNLKAIQLATSLIRAFLCTTEFFLLSQHCCLLYENLIHLPFSLPPNDLYISAKYDD